MTVGFIVRPEAEVEADDAATWYEAQRPGLGREFVGELDRTLVLIRERPLLYAPVHHELRRTLIRRFPYGVYCIVDDTQVSVIAILHLSRSPELWKSRTGP